MNTELLAFYKGEAPMSSGIGRASGKRFLSDVLGWDNMALESVHDYIQWIFPLKEASDYNRLAPLLDDETIETFKTDPRVRLNVEAACVRMGGFLEIPAGASHGGLQFGKATHKPHWVDQYNHNYKRATRMIASLRLMGFEASAASLYEALYDLHSKYGTEIGTETLAFWKKAATAPIDQLMFK